MEYKYLSMVTNIKVSIKRVSFTEKENIYGQMDLHIKEISNRVWDMVMVVGNQHILILIFMFEPI
jgi:hypothetical protein